jgi:hypothetical protein
MSKSSSALPCLPMTTMALIGFLFSCCCLNVAKANPDVDSSPSSSSSSSPSSQWDQYIWSDDVNFSFTTYTHKQFWSDYLCIFLVIAIPSLILIGCVIGIMTYQRYKNIKILAKADRIISQITSINRNDDADDDDDDNKSGTTMVSTAKKILLLAI